MSKKFSSALALLVLFCLIAGTGLPHASAQRETARTAQNAALVSTTQDVLEETSEIRELRKAVEELRKGGAAPGQ